MTELQSPPDAQQPTKASGQVTIFDGGPRVPTAPIDATKAPIAAMRAAFDDYAHGDDTQAGGVGTDSVVVTPPRDEAGKFVSPNPAPQSAPPGAPPAPQRSARIAAMARSVGLTDADIAELQDDELLSIVHGSMLSRGGSASGPVGAPPGAPPVLNTPAEPVYNWGTSDDGTPYSPEDYPEHIRLSIIAGQEYPNAMKRIAELEAKLERFTGKIVKREQGEWNKYLDDFFSRNPEIFGQGKRQELAANSPEMRVRMRFLRNARELGIDDPAECCERMLTEMYPFAKQARPAAAPPAPQAQPQQTQQQQRGYAAPPSQPQPANGIGMDQWMSSAPMAPTHRQDVPMPPGREAAIAKLELLRKESGIDSNDDFDIGKLFLPANGKV